MVCIVARLVSSGRLSFYLIFSLDTPYTGKLSVDASPFYWAISSLETYIPENKI